MKLEINNREKVLILNAINSVKEYTTEYDILYGKINKWRDLNGKKI